MVMPWAGVPTKRPTLWLAGVLRQDNDLFRPETSKAPSQKKLGNARARE
jgi:hypothetical protein